MTLLKIVLRPMIWSARSNPLPCGEIEPPHISVKISHYPFTVMLVALAALVWFLISRSCFARLRLWSDVRKHTLPSHLPWDTDVLRKRFRRDSFNSFRCFLFLSTAY